MFTATVVEPMVTTRPLMVCCVCKKKEAKVHLTQIVGENMQKVDLCEECASQKGVNDPAGFSLTDLLLGLSPSQETDAGGASDSSKCPQCGFSQADFNVRVCCPCASILSAARFRSQCAVPVQWLCALHSVSNHCTGTAHSEASRCSAPGVITKSLLLKPTLHP